MKNLQVSAKIISAIFVGSITAVWLGHQPINHVCHVKIKSVYKQTYTHQQANKQANKQADKFRYVNQVSNVAHFISANWKLPLAKATVITQNVLYFSKLRHLSPSLVFGVISTESSFDQYAYSNRGAVGLMQGYPTAHWKYVTQHNLIGANYKHLFNIADNIQFGTYVLQKYMKYKTSADVLSHYFGICNFDSTYVTRVIKYQKQFQKVLLHT